jgi:hypothetical protein
MNIFFLDRNPRKAAEYLVDKHVVKMILESAQMLSTAHRVLDGQKYSTLSKSKKRKVTQYKLFDERETLLYDAAFINNPCSVWARETSANYLWLLKHLHGILIEYTLRYGKIHSVMSNRLYGKLKTLPKNIPKGKLTDPPMAMLDKYVVHTDPVVNYRNYYRKGKKHLHQYNHYTKAPIWLKHKSSKWNFPQENILNGV